MPADVIKNAAHVMKIATKENSLGCSESRT
jgi:hypothetical protein